MVLLVIYPQDLPSFDAEIPGVGVNARPESQGLCPRARSQMWSARPFYIAMAAAKQGKTMEKATWNREFCHGKMGNLR